MKALLKAGTVIGLAALGLQWLNHGQEGRMGTYGCSDALKKVLRQKKGQSLRLAAPPTANLVPAMQLAPRAKKKLLLMPAPDPLRIYRSSMRLCATYLCALCVLVPSVGRAQLIGTNMTYDETLRGARNVVALDETLFGDKINLQDGRVVFEQNDVVLATNSDLRVQIGRKTPTGSRGRDMAFSSQGLDREFAVFGIGWELNVPYMMGTYDSRDGRFSRCSTGNFVAKVRQPSTLPYEADPLVAHMFWNGIKINIPGQGEEQLLKVNSGQVLPADGKTYVGTTKSSWRVRCLSEIENGLGEGFAVVLPDGTIYYFDWMAIRDAVDLTISGTTDHNGDYWDSGDLLAPLADVFLYATKIEDRFGNFVSYTYDENHPNRIKSIESSDGVRLDVEYNTSGQIYKVKSSGRTWTYGYETFTADNGFKRLSSIELPDGSEWKFSFQRRSSALTPEGNFWKNCAADPGFMTSDAPIVPARFNIMTMTHPSGAKGEFRFLRLFHGTNNTPGGCQSFTTGQFGLVTFGTYGVPSAYAEDSLYEKKISGPGVPNRIWNYKYYPSWSFSSQCGSGCPTTSQTTVQANDGVMRRYTFGNSYSLNFGQLLTETIEQNGVVRIAKSYAYLSSASGQPFPDNAGSIPAGGTTGWPGDGFNYGNPLTFKHRPLRVATTQLDGVSFVRSVNAFDSFVRPHNVTKSSTISGNPAKIEVIEYHDDLSLWVLGQVKLSTTNGIETSKTDYGWKALPGRIYRFSKLQQTIGYYTSGTPGSISSITDGNGNKTWLKSWKRGIPQLIQYPATPDQPSGESKSAVVNNDGTIASVTDENGYQTSYGYDAMGRLASIDYPDETNLTWNNTSLSFVKINVPEYNIPAGHWRQTVMTGTGRKLVYFDALWRPLIVREDDTSQITATRRVTRHAYDAAGRRSFTSYPVADGIPPDIGIHSTYDALDRVTSVTQDSELGPLTTTTEYLPGFQTRITNPRGKQTLTTLYLAYDQPSYEWPRGINHPEGAYTEIYRDVFGKPTAVKRRNSTGSIAATRYWMYDTNQLLCKSVEPETGTTIYTYDDAGNLTRTSFGIPLTMPSACSLTLAGIDGVPPPTGGENPPSAAHYATRTYDARNRITSLVFADHLSDTTYHYTSDSQLASITALDNGGNNVTTQYHYNKRGLLEEERMLWNGINWPINYTYNTNGHLATQRSPVGLVIDYAPNALGQPQQAGSYADNVSYYPNGAIKQFTYGNGIVHTMTQNARQLPERSRDVYGSTVFLDDSYDYDKNGNVAGISDALPGHRGDRTMTYDGLDRLFSATSPMFPGGTAYRYDVLDNLTRVVAPGRNHWYCYDSYWRLTNVKTGSCSGTTVIGLGYDVQGNLANKNGQTFDFDYGNRLRSASGSPASSYVYDGHGRRVRDYTTASKYSQYSQSGQLVFANDYRQNKWFDHVYLGGSLVAIRERNSANGVYTTKYQHTDALGSPVAVTNQARTVLERREYEPYGRQLRPTAPVDGPGFTGHVLDAATGLNYMQQRYYDPLIGRFLSVDPVTANSSTGANFNRYWYANNNPYRFTDPDGRASWEGTWDILKGIGKAIADGMLSDAHNSSPNPSVEAYPGEFSQAEACGCDYQSPFAAPATNEEQFGRDIAPAVGLATALLIKSPVAGETAVIGRVKDIGNLARGERSLLSRLPNRGNPQANWRQNAGVLRQEMSRGLPIRDASPGDAGGQFLNAERNLLQDRGWTFDSKTNFWVPPK